MQGGIPREDLWVTSKLWNDKHAEEDVIPACRQSLADLRLDYLDLYLVHWPFPNFHGKGVDVTARDPHARPYIHEDYMKTWRQMETLVDRGLVRHIGTSNMTIPKLELVLRDARIKPGLQRDGTAPPLPAARTVPVRRRQWHRPDRLFAHRLALPPERDRTAEDTVDMEDPVIVQIAERLGVHPAVVCVKWAVQRGQIPIPFSVKRVQYLSNLRPS